MNRPGAVPQSLRGLPGFGGQQQHQQPGRAVSNRLPPNGKLAGNGTGWAFGGGVPLSGGAALGNPSIPGSRQPGGNVSFAQSLSGGSQPATPLDLSEFPSLSNNPQHNQGQSTMWSAGARNLGAPSMPQRSQGTPGPQASQQPDDLFNGASRLTPAQGSFRFGNQPSQNAQPQRSSVDDFPPLNRNANGEIGQERGANLMNNFGFGPAGASPAPSAQAGGAGNGLLNALSANSRSSDARSPANGTQSRDARGSIGDDEVRQKNGPFREDSIASQSSLAGAQASSAETRNPHGAIGVVGAVGGDSPVGNAKDDVPDQPSQDNINTPAVPDPLAGMSASERWGIKGLRHMMNVHPDQTALLTGIDPARLGLDLQAPELISEQIFSLFDDAPPIPGVPRFKLPECYQVNNVQPIENKIGSFNEETLMWIFYSCPGDVKQLMAAQELNTRNWRWHKKAQVWLTKDDTMQPHVISSQHERGYYIVWDTTQWRKERKEFTLYYADLEAPQPPPA